MFNFGKPKFYTKTKSLIKLTKTRLDAIRKKRSAVEKYLRNDIADLLRNGLDINAYGRAEGLLIEQNMTYCYILLEQYCECITAHLSEMQKQRECPQECKEAVPSLMYAAARFSDLPELRNLRNMFTEKYGNDLDPFVNKEFVERLRSSQPTKEMKFQLMREIAEQFSIAWDSKALEQKLFRSPPPVQNYSIPRSRSRNDQNKPTDLRDCNAPKGNDNVVNKYNNPPSSSDDEVITNRARDSISQDSQQTSSSSVESVSVSEDEVESKKPFYYQFIPPPYFKSNVAAAKEDVVDHPIKEKKDHQDNHEVVDEKPKPRSVRRRNAKLAIEVEAKPGEEEGKTREDHGDHHRDVEEDMLDKLLMKLSKKKAAYEVNEVVKGKLKPPPGRKSEELYLPASRASSVPVDSTETSEAAARKHVRAYSVDRHVHPKMPDFDEVAARIAALHGK